MFQRKFLYPLLWLCLACGMVYDSNGASFPAEPDISSPPQQERSIYVSPKGSNSNSGTSRDQPLRTIDRATRIVRPEQVIVLLPGIYHESVDLEDFGSLSGVITIRGEGSSPKDRAVLDGQGSKDVGISVYNGRNLVFENLEIRNYTDVGLWIEFSKRVTIRGNIFYHNGFSSQDPDFDGEGFGLNVTESEDVLIELNEAYRNGPGPKRRANNALGTGIDTFALKNSIIRGNYSHDNIGGGFLIEDGINVTFEDNRAEDNDGDASAFEWWDAGLWVDGGRDVTVRNNVFKGNLGAGIQISDEDFQNPTGYLVEDNDIRENYFGLYIWNFGKCFPDEKVLHLINNTVTGNIGGDIWCGEGWILPPPP